MNLKLWVSSNEADDIDIFAGIKKLDRQGNEVNFLTSTILNKDKLLQVG